MPPSARGGESTKTGGCGRGALFFLGFLVVAIQLLILFQLSRHATVVDMSAGAVHHLRQPRESTFKSNTTRGKTQQQQVAKRRQSQQDKRTPDGTFNGLPIYFTTDASIDSTASCVGENYQDNAYMYRSCYFTHFCFDTVKKDYVLFQSPQEQEWQQYVSKDVDIGTSITMSNITVALGGLNPKWMERAFRKLEWFPEVILDSGALKEEGYYQLPSDVVWVPFHSFAGFNAGHIIWDDFLPIFTLLEMFGMQSEAGMKPLLTRYVLKDDALWATCDSRDENKAKCAALFAKFLPAMNVDPSSFSTTEDFVFKPNTQKKSKYVCAQHGAAGMAFLTDHGTKAHGWEPTDYQSTHNMGRGPMIYAFRNFMLQNLNIPTTPLYFQQEPYNVVFSKFSSRSGKRRTGFEKQLESVQAEFSSEKVLVRGEEMQTLSLVEQATMASQAAVWVTSCGGGAVTATFLPRGAAVIIYYDPKGSIVRNKPRGTPARLDWDLFNHMSHLRVHWLPTPNMHTPEGLKVLNELIRSELHVIEHQKLAMTNA